MKKHKKLLSVLLTLVMALSIIPAFTLPAAADVWDGTWDGSGFSGSGSTYTISSAKGLAQFINNCGRGTSYEGCTIYLDVDVDLNGIDFGNPSGGKNVYYSRDNYFRGTFDGRNHTISNFTMTNTDHRIGLFRSAVNATFRNLTFTNVFIDDVNNNKKNGFGVLVGWAQGNLTIENVHVAGGNVYGYNYVGGLVGEIDSNDALTITNCSNNARIQADNNRAGGIVGHTRGHVYATNCSNTAYVYAGYSDAGGIVGWIEDDESYFVDCTNTGEITTDACAGGIFGYFGSKDNDYKMTLDSCTNEGKITSRGNGYCAGGIAGKINSDNNRHIITNCVNRGEVNAKEDAGGIVGANIGYGYWDNNKNYGSVFCNNDNAGGILGEVEDDAQEFHHCYNTGSVQGKNSVGGVLGYGNAAAHTFYDCANGGAVTSTNDSAGGIYGYGGNTEPTIEQCWNIGTIRAYNDAGGILGHTAHHSYIRRCWNAGSIETYNHNENGAHGGIVGQTSDLSSSSNDNPNMTDCYNWGPVSGGRDDGGLIGKIKDGRTPYYITNSYNAGTVTGTRPFAIIAYGGNVGNNVYYDSNVSMGDTQGTAISDSNLKNSSGFSSNYCKNTWGVKIGSTTYYYPILNWYRNLFMFHLKFVDNPSGTNVYWDGEYGSAFYAINPTRRGYTPSDWYLTTDSGKTIAYGLDVVTCGVTPCTERLLMTQHTDELTTIDNTSTFNLTWEKIRQKLDMNAVLDGEYRFDNINFFTADVYVNGVLVADDVNDFYGDLYYEDTYEIKDIKPAEGYVFVGPFLGVHDGCQQSGLTGAMDLDLIEVAPEFKTLHTVTFKNKDGGVLSTQQVPHGDDATPPADQQDYIDETYHYTFNGWSGYTNITADTVIQATFTATEHVFDQQNHDGDYLKQGATCTEPAQYYYSCVCGYTNSVTYFEYGDPNYHRISACEPNGDGTHDWICEVCGDRSPDDCGPYDETQHAATCTTGAYITRTCVYCHYSYDGEKGVPNGHQYGEAVSNNNGTHTRTCTVCAEGTDGHSVTADCDYDETPHAATCITGAYITYTCKDCGYSYDGEKGEPSGHQYGDWVPNENGTHTKTCSVCAEGTEGHSVTADCDYNETQHDATCITGAYITYTCKDCGYSFDGEKGEPGGHQYGDWVPNENGTHTKTCS
ncbi:MAG: hypothetical protein IK104_10945, partial [Clostridia bacterium]|nr:hypothetical protein [Clostridia bacterium]